MRGCFKPNIQRFNLFLLAFLIVGDFLLHVRISLGQQQVAENIKLIGRLSDCRTPHDLFIKDDYAYVAAVESLKIVNVSNPSSPVEAGSCDTPEWAWGIYLLDNYAYVANGRSGFRIIDISDPSSPKEVGHYETLGDVEDVHVLGSYAYVAECWRSGRDDWASGLRIIDISNPSSLTEVGHCSTPGWARNLHVLDNYAYIADGRSGLRIIDVSNPSSPKEVGHYDTPGDARGLYILGNYAYIAEGVSGLRIIDISNPSSPREMGHYDTSGCATGVSVLGKYAYVADKRSGLRIIDVSNPFSPREVGYYDIPCYACGLYLFGDYVYVAGGESGLWIFRFSPPIYGKVTGREGRSLEGVRIEVLKDGLLERSTFTDVSGNYSIPGLRASETYSLKASKEGYIPQIKDNINPGDEVIFILEVNLRPKVFANEENRISLPDRTRIVISKGALSSDTFLNISFPDLNTAPPSKLKSIGVYREFSLENGQNQFLGGKMATIWIPYKDENDDGIVDGTDIKENTLKVFFWNGREWVRDFETKIDTLNNLAILNTPHLTIFGLFGMVAPDLSDLVVYPTPFKSSGRDTEIRFERLTENATIRIYNIAGELVKIKENITTGYFDWDTRNDSGEKVVSGVYIYVITDSKGRIKKGKVAIIR